MRALARRVVWGLALVAGAPAWADAEIVHWSTGRTSRSVATASTATRLPSSSTPAERSPARRAWWSVSNLTKSTPVRLSPPVVSTPRGSGRRVGAAGPQWQPVRGLDRQRGAPACVDPRLVHAVIRAESNFQARARSRRGARGLMQLMPATLRQYAVRQSLRPGRQHRRRDAPSAEIARSLHAERCAGRLQRRTGRRHPAWRRAPVCRDRGVRLAHPPRGLGPARHRLCGVQSLRPGCRARRSRSQRASEPALGRPSLL